MARDLEFINVIDLECTCWRDSGPPRGQQQEIIEIGIAVFNANTLTLADTESILLKPEHSEVSEFCTELTTITADMLEDGVTFAEACQSLRSNYDSKNRTWASWGDFDRRMFQRQCGQYAWGDVNYPFGPTHLNVKNLYALRHKLKREVGMEKALDQLGMELTGTHHRGVDDAWNIARILKGLLS